jgi:hypothetical protein
MYVAARSGGEHVRFPWLAVVCMELGWASHFLAVRRYV